MTHHMTTTEALDSLPVGSIVRTPDAQVWELRANGWDCLSEDGTGGAYDSHAVLYQTLPPTAAVIYRPDAPSLSGITRERIAQALYAHREATGEFPDGPTAWDDLPQSWRDEWRDAANAVLALRPEPCPTCSPPVRETAGMICQTCGTDYASNPAWLAACNPSVGEGRVDTHRIALAELERLRALLTARPRQDGTP